MASAGRHRRQLGVGVSVDRVRDHSLGAAGLMLVDHRGALTERETGRRD